MFKTISNKLIHKKMSFDVESCRKQFPALQQNNHVYLDNAGGSQCLGTVIEDIKTYLSTTNVQLGGSYDIGEKSNTLYSEGFAAAIKYINATSQSEVVIGSSTTQLYRNLSWSLKWQAGDEIILSKTNHEANLAPWVGVAEDRGLKIRWWEHEPSLNPQLKPDDLRKLVNERTRFVAVPHVSNLLGTLNDVKGIAMVLHELKGDALICVDGVAYAPHGVVDVRDLGVDFYAFSWYKVYGPHIAILYASQQAQKQMRSLGHFFKPAASLEDKLGLAGASYELLASLPKVVEYLGGSNPASFFNPSAKHEEALQTILLDFLASRLEVTIIGERTGDRNIRVPTISFLVKGRSSKEFVFAVDKQRPDGLQYGVRWGHFYAKRLCDDILGVGEDGVVRVSMVHYNTVQEIQDLVSVLQIVLDEPPISKP